MITFNRDSFLTRPTPSQPIKLCCIESFKKLRTTDDSRKAAMHWVQGNPLAKDRSPFIAWKACIHLHAHDLRESKTRMHAHTDAQVSQVTHGKPPATGTVSFKDPKQRHTCTHAHTRAHTHARAHAMCVLLHCGGVQGSRAAVCWQHLCTYGGPEPSRACPLQGPTPN